MRFCKTEIKVSRKMLSRSAALLLVLFLSISDTAQCQRIKDIADIQGMRGNPLRGIGLVIGLSNTGDSTAPSQQMLTNVFRNSELVLDPKDFGGGNVAVVIVTAELGPFAREGSTLNVLVSSVGDAKSLKGGRLLATALKGLDGEVYAVASGSVSIAGWTVSGGGGDSISKNHQTVGNISGGAYVEREELSTFYEHIGGNRVVTLNLRSIDFSTAQHVSQAIDKLYPESAIVIDAGTIKIKIPESISQTQIAGFVAEITKLQVKVDTPAVVVINERTGTIVVGENVRISPTAISQGSLVVKVKEMQLVSQPTASFSDAGETVVTQDTYLDIYEPEGILIPVPQIVTVSDLARTLSAIGASPTDLIAIFHALERSGKLQAKLIEM